jgi:hypothetical protein
VAIDTFFSDVSAHDDGLDMVDQRWSNSTVALQASSQISFLCVLEAHTQEKVCFQAGPEFAH